MFLPLLPLSLATFLANNSSFLAVITVTVKITKFSPFPLSVSAVYMAKIITPLSPVLATAKTSPQPFSQLRTVIRVAISTTKPPVLAVAKIVFISLLFFITTIFPCLFPRWPAVYYSVTISLRPYLRTGRSVSGIGFRE